MFNSESFPTTECYHPYTSALFVTYTNTSYRHPQEMYWLSRECTNRITTPFGEIPYVCHAQIVQPRETVVYQFPGTGNGYLLKNILSGSDIFSLLPVMGGKRYKSTAFNEQVIKPLRSFFP